MYVLRHTLPRGRVVFARMYDGVFVRASATRAVFVIHAVWCTAVRHAVTQTPNIRATQPRNRCGSRFRVQRVRKRHPAWMNASAKACLFVSSANTGVGNEEKSRGRAGENGSAGGWWGKERGNPSNGLAALEPAQGSGGEV